MRQGTRLLINNRQGGRRRGRGGQRPQNISGRPDGNRQDNRQRGNAAQLLEKYKALARDMQLAGDRVQTEYYLQFADHYFRVLGESRSRFDEQQRPRGDDDDGDDDRMDADMDGDNDSDLDQDDQPQQHQQRSRSDEQPQRSRSDEQPQRNRARPAADRSEPRRDRPNGRVRDDDDGRARNAPRENVSEERIDFAVLPPAIGADDGNQMVDRDEEEAPRPKRRVRRPRADEPGGDDVSAS